MPWGRGAALQATAVSYQYLRKLDGFRSLSVITIEHAYIKKATVVFLSWELKGMLRKCFPDFLDYCRGVLTCRRDSTVYRSAFHDKK